MPDNNQDDPIFIEERMSGVAGRDYIEALGIDLSQRNAYGELMALYKDGRKYPVVCDHGAGSMWLCRECKNLIVKKSMEE